MYMQREKISKQTKTEKIEKRTIVGFEIGKDMHFNQSVKHTPLNNAIKSGGRLRMIYTIHVVCASHLSTYRLHSLVTMQSML